MSITYEPLWKLLDTLSVSKMDFAKTIDISSTTLAKLSKNEPITLTIIDKICNQYHCSINEVVAHIPDRELPIGKMTLRPGMIVSASETRSDKTFTREYVILRLIPIDPISDYYLYFIAPISSRHTCPTPFDYPCRNVKVGDELYNGTILLSSARVTPAVIFKKILGSFPDTFMHQLLLHFDNIIDRKKMKEPSGID